MKFNAKKSNCSIIRKFHYPTFVSLLILIRKFCTVYHYDICWKAFYKYPTINLHPPTHYNDYIVAGANIFSIIKFILIFVLIKFLVFMIRYVFNINMNFAHSYQFQHYFREFLFLNINVFLHFFYQYYFHFNKIIPVNILQRTYTPR